MLLPISLKTVYPFIPNTSERKEYHLKTKHIFKNPLQHPSPIVYFGGGVELQQIWPKINLLKNLYLLLETEINWF